MRLTRGLLGRSLLMGGTFAAAVGLGVATPQAEEAAAYLDRTRPLERRVEDLLARLTLDANNQEVERGTIDVEMDERTLREIYLPVFKAAVQEARVLAVMGAYNKFRGQHCCHNDYLAFYEVTPLDGILRRAGDHVTVAFSAGYGPECDGECVTGVFRLARTTFNHEGARAPR